MRCRVEWRRATGLDQRVSSAPRRTAREVFPQAAHRQRSPAALRRDRANAAPPDVGKAQLLVPNPVGPLPVAAQPALLSPASPVPAEAPVGVGLELVERLGRVGVGVLARPAPQPSLLCSTLWARLSPRPWPASPRAPAAGPACTPVGSEPRGSGPYHASWNGAAGRGTPGSQPLGGSGHPGLVGGQGEPKLAQVLGAPGPQPLRHRVGRHDQEVVGVAEQPGVQPARPPDPRSTQLRSSSCRSMLASTGELGPPWGTPTWLCHRRSCSMSPARNHARMRAST
jgi:hypothetical protein